MALPSFLKRKSPTAPAAPSNDDAGVVRARSSARRRLIGAAVLLAVGVIAFPLLFETQPRPIPVDIPIEIPRKDGQPPLVTPPKTARQSAGAVGEPVVRAVGEPASPPAAGPSAAASTPAATAAPASAAVPAKAPVAASAAPRSEPAPAPAKASSAAPAAKAASAPTAAIKPVPDNAKPAAASDGGRYVVQVGAFADVTAAREARMKVEKLGLKTYTQVVETAQGRRIRVRVGPFESNDEASKVLARLKAAKLPGAVLTL